MDTSRLFLFGILLMPPLVNASEEPKLLAVDLGTEGCVSAKALTIDGGLCSKQSLVTGKQQYVLTFKVGVALGEEISIVVGEGAKIDYALVLRATIEASSESAAVDHISDLLENHPEEFLDKMKQAFRKREPPLPHDAHSGDMCSAPKNDYFKFKNDYPKIKLSGSRVIRLKGAHEELEELRQACIEPNQLKSDDSFLQGRP